MPRIASHGRARLHVRLPRRTKQARIGPVRPAVTTTARPCASSPIAVATSPTAHGELMQLCAVRKTSLRCGPRPVVCRKSTDDARPTGQEGTRQTNDDGRRTTDDALPRRVQTRSVENDRHHCIAELRLFERLAEATPERLGAREARTQIKRRDNAAGRRLLLEPLQNKLVAVWSGMRHSREMTSCNENGKEIFGLL